MIFHTFLRTLLLPAAVLLGARTAVAQTCEDALPDYQSVPSLPELPEEGYMIREFGLGIYAILDGINTAMVVVSTSSVIVVDCPPAFGETLLPAVRRITSLPVSHVVYTHFHYDHIGGAYIFGKNVTFIGHADTASNLVQLQDPNRPVPSVTFRDDHCLTVGNQTLELSYKGELHSDGNIFIYAPKQKVLMLADFLYPGWSPSGKLGVAKNVLAYIRAHDQVLAYDFDYFIGVHVGLVGDRGDVLIQKEYFSDLRSFCIDTVNEFRENQTLAGCPDGFNLADSSNLYGFARRLFEVLAASCANRLIEKWGDRLAGVDVVAYQNADTVIDSLRLESGIVPFVF